MYNLLIKAVYLQCQKETRLLFTETKNTKPEKGKIKK